MIKLDFDDCDLIFKVTRGLRLLKHGLSSPCLLGEWIEIDHQNCIAILLGHEQEPIRSDNDDLDPI